VVTEKGKTPVEVVETKTQEAPKKEVEKVEVKQEEKPKKKIFSEQQRAVEDIFILVGEVVGVDPELRAFVEKNWK